LSDWLEERLGHRRIVREALDEPVPGGARWAYVFGSVLVLLLLVQAVTGVLLMTAYAPSATTAWASVMYISTTMSAGWLVRGLHHYAAQAMVVVLALHLVQTAWFGAYRRPREMNWLVGLALMGLVLGFALTGYLLPWDQKGYWATKVATNIAGSVPLVGPVTQRLLVGGPEYGHLTLTRFYALHVAVLPLATLLLLVLHVALFRRHGVTPPASADRTQVDLFYPKQVGMDLAAGLLVLAACFALALRTHGADLDAPADPASDYPARPEWYFLALFEALKYAPGALEWVAAVGVPLAVGGYLVALPWLDRSPGAAPRGRAAVLAPLGLALLGAVALTALSVRADATDPAFQKARALASRRAERARLLARDGVPPAGPLAMLASDPETRGPELFARHCAPCHRLGELGPPPGKDAAPDLAGFGTEAWVKSLLDDPDAPRFFGKTPFRGMMPSVTRKPSDPQAAELFSPMKPDDMQAIAAFLAAEARGVPHDQRAGETLVRQRCTICHRLDGKTDDEASLAPELRGWGSLGWIEQHIANPGSGKTYPPAAMAKELDGHMPAFADELSAADIKLLAIWVERAARAP
jgi:ubiquinol-cytochrome c reductase cytochrome b subunit